MTNHEQRQSKPRKVRHLLLTWGGSKRIGAYLHDVPARVPIFADIGLGDMAGIPYVREHLLELDRGWIERAKDDPVAFAELWREVDVGAVEPIRSLEDTDGFYSQGIALLFASQRELEARLDRSIAALKDKELVNKMQAAGYELGEGLLATLVHGGGGTGSAAIGPELERLLRQKLAATGLEYRLVKIQLSPEVLGSENHERARLYANTEAGLRERLYFIRQDDNEWVADLRFWVGNDTARAIIDSKGIRHPIRYSSEDIFAMVAVLIELLEREEVFSTLFSHYSPILAEQQAEMVSTFGLVEITPQSEKVRERVATQLALKTLQLLRIHGGGEDAQ